MSTPGFRSLRLGSVALFALLAAPAVGGEIDAKSRIEAVTVFADGAMVTRTAEVDLPTGASLVIFRGLPLTIDPRSLRIEGQGDAPLVLGSVDARLTPVDPAKSDSVSDAQLRTLRVDRESLAASLDTAETRKAMIQRFAQFGPDRPGEQGRGLEVEKWSSAWDAVAVAMARVNEDLRKIRQSIRELDEKIKALEATESQRRSRTTPEREFTLVLDTSKPVKGKLVLSYRVNGAGWRPIYDAHLDATTAGTPANMKLTRRAIVTQRTGEDWTDVAMTLSTVRQARGTAAPELPPERVGFYEPPVVLQQGRPRATANEAMRSIEPAQDKGAPPAAPQVMREQEAGVEANGYEAAWRIAGLVSVPKDGSQKSMMMQSREMAPELSVRATPSVDRTAYLDAVFVNTDEAPLLPGEVTLMRGRTFVGRGTIAFTAPGDRVQLGFGADDNVRILRVPVRRRETEPSLMGSTRTDTREFRTVVRNLHAFPVKMSLQDRIPYSEAANIVVDMLPATTAPTDKSVQDRRGVLGWTFDLKPGEEREIRLAYRVRWPADRDISYEPQPMPR